MSESEEESAASHQANIDLFRVNPHVSEARGMLSGFEDLTAEEQRGALDHAIAALENARRDL